MTTDVKLPEPVACRWRGSGRVHYLRWVYANAGSPSTPPSGAEPLYTADQVRAHAAKLLAENERLRAKYQRAAESSEHFAARAERLAEALRSLAANWDERCNTVLRQARDADESEVSQYHITAGALAGCAHELRAALDQEGGNG